MLVLSRRRDEAIMIGDDVEVTIVDIRGDKVRLGIKAPSTVAVHRREIFDSIEAKGDLMKTPLSIDCERKNDAFLQAAIDEAKKGLSEGGLPIGSVLVRGNQIIGSGHNRRVQDGNPMAHAEIDCLAKAGRQGTYKDTILYSTLMPCYLCSGAAVQFGIPKVIIGESVNFHGGQGKDGSLAFMRTHGIEVVDLHDAQCIELMSTFIRDHPTLWNEDIGRADE